MEIEILGTGCPNCRALEATTREALSAAGRDDATVKKIEEMADIVRYGVLSLPALVVDGEVVLSGRLPETDELASLLDPGT